MSELLDLRKEDGSRKGETKERELVHRTAIYTVPPMCGWCVTGPVSYTHLDSQYTGSSVPPKQKKKKGFGRTLAKTVCIALVFGVVAGAAFQGTNFVGQKLFGDKVTASAGQNTTGSVSKPEVGTVQPVSYTHLEKIRLCHHQSSLRRAAGGEGSPPGPVPGAWRSLWAP